MNILTPTWRDRTRIIVTKAKCLEPDKPKVVLLSEVTQLIEAWKECFC